METIEELKREIDSTWRDASGRRQFSKELRARVVEFAGAQKTAGQSLRSTGEQLGIQAELIWKWTADAKKVKRGPKLVEVQIEENPRSRQKEEGPQLILPNGARVVGLGIEDLASLIRSL